MMDINVNLLQCIKLLIKKRSGWATTLTNKSAIKNENISNKELEEELHKQLKNLIKEKYTHISRQYLGCKFSRYAIDKYI